MVAAVGQTTVAAVNLNSVYAASPQFTSAVNMFPHLFTLKEGVKLCKRSPIGKDEPVKLTSVR